MTREQREEAAWEAHCDQAEMAYPIVAALCEIDTDLPEHVWKQQVIDIVTGCPNWVFWRIDDKPESYGFTHDGKYWHHKLRQVRNDLSYDIFEALLPPSEDAKLKE